MKDYVIPFSISFCAGVGVWLFTKDLKTLLIFIFFVISLSAFFYFTFSYRHVGIINWAKKRGYANSFRKCLEKVNSRVDFLASWGGSVPSLSPNIEQTFTELVKEGCVFRFLLLKPGSRGVKEREISRGEWKAGEPETSIRWFLNIKGDLGAMSSRFRVAVYSYTPIWAMVILDNKYGIIGFYGKGVGRDNPGIIVKRVGHKPSFLEPFIAEFDRLWSNAEELYSTADLDTILQQKENDNNKAFVLAITGPSGIGKTTICRLLTEEGIGVLSKTVTTRAPRENEVEIDQYEFMTKDKFEQISRKGDLLCETYFCNDRYGIKSQMVFDVIESGKILILDTIIPPLILKKMLSNKVAIVFLSPSSLSRLKDILNRRLNLSQEELKLRLKAGKKQMKEAIDSDYILNADRSLNSTLKDIEMIINSIKKSYKSYGSIFPDNLAQFRAESVIQEKGIDINED